MPNDDGRTTTKTEEEEEGESRASTLSLIVYSCANMALFRLEREADGEKAQRHVASLPNSKRYTNVTGTVGVTVTPQLSADFRTNASLILPFYH